MQAAPPTAEDVAALARWRQDPVAYFREVLGVSTLWDRQIELINSVRDYRETYCPAGHSVSKDFTAGRLVCWWITTRRGIAITTANTREQVRDVLWGELREGYANAKIPLGGDLMPVDARWSFDPKWYAIGLTARETNAFQGKHADDVLAVGDEAGGLPPWVFLALSSCAVGDADRLLFIGNLTCGPDHEFAKECRRPSIPKVRNVVRIPSWDSPNVKAGRTVIKGLCTQTYIDEIVRKYGEHSAIYNARVAAKDPEAGGTSLIGYAHIDKAKARRAALPEVWVPHESVPIRLGCDPARFGRDSTTIWMGQGPHAARLDRLTKWDGDAIAERIAYHIKSLHPVSVAVDVSGGLGVAPVVMLRDRMRRGECPDTTIYEINFGSGPSLDLEMEVANKRAELYWRVRDWLWGEAAVDLEESVVEELIAPTYTMTGKPSRVLLEPKEKLMERLGRSPDDADGLACAVAGHLGQGGSMFAGPSTNVAKPDPYADPEPGEEEDDQPRSARERSLPRGAKPWHR